MQGEIEVGLHLVGDNPNLTFIFFVALVLLLVLGLRFGLYARRNDRATEVGDDTLWTALAVVGLTAALFALLGLVEIVSSLRTPFRRAIMLAHVVALSHAVTTLCRAILPSESSARVPETVWTAGAAAAVAVFLGSLVDPASGIVLAVHGLSAGAFAAVGLAVGRRGISATRVQGTVVDSLLRHLLPVLLFAAMVPIADLAVLASLDRAIVLHIQVVFIIMTATALMTATIKLRQNLAGL